MRRRTFLMAAGAASICRPAVAQDIGPIRQAAEAKGFRFGSAIKSRNLRDADFARLIEREMRYHHTGIRDQTDIHPSVRRCRSV